MREKHQEHSARPIDEDTLIFSLDEILGLESYPIPESVTLQEAQSEYIKAMKKELELVEAQNGNLKKRMKLFQRVMLNLSRDAIRMGDMAAQFANDLYD